MLLIHSDNDSVILSLATLPLRISAIVTKRQPPSHAVAAKTVVRACGCDCAFWPTYTRAAVIGVFSNAARPLA
jgi:hypothetical protein